MSPIATQTYRDHTQNCLKQQLVLAVLVKPVVRYRLTHKKSRVNLVLAMEAKLLSPKCLKKHQNKLKISLGFLGLFFCFFFFHEVLLKIISWPMTAFSSCNLKIVQSSIQPDLEHLQGWGIPSFSGQSVTGFTVKNFFLISKPSLPVWSHCPLSCHSRPLSIAPPHPSYRFPSGTGNPW